MSKTMNSCIIRRCLSMFVFPGSQARHLGQGCQLGRDAYLTIIERNGLLLSLFLASGVYLEEPIHDSTIKPRAGSSELRTTNSVSANPGGAQAALSSSAVVYHVTKQEEYQSIKLVEHRSFLQKAA